MTRSRRGIGLHAIVASALAWLGCADAPREPLLLLLTIDTMRADHIGAYGGPTDLTPNLDALIADSLRFDAAYSTSAYTLPAVGALMTGRYPEEIGMQTNVSLLEQETLTLAELLRLQGWRSGAVVSNFVLGEDSGIHRGFDYFDAKLETLELNRKMPERLATDTTEAALAMLDQLANAPELGRSGVFLWVHYQDPHGPYTPPEALRAAQLAAARADPAGNPQLRVGNHLGFGHIPDYQFIEGQHEAAFYRAGYRGEIAFTDQEVGRLLNGLDERGWLSNAVIVFTADHGEALGEADYWFAHGEYLSDALVRVPFAIRSRDLPAGVRDDVASHVDLFPTLLGVLGLPARSDYPGRDLLDPTPADAEIGRYMATLRGSLVPRFGLVRGGYKYVMTRPRGLPPEERLFRVGDDSENLAAELPGLVGEMRRQLIEVRRGLRKPRTITPRNVSDEDRVRLRALGYDVSE